MRNRKTKSPFRDNSEVKRGDFTTRQIFSQFSRKRAHDNIIFKMRLYLASRIDTEKLTWILLYLAAVRNIKLGHFLSIFQHLSR